MIDTAVVTIDIGVRFAETDLIGVVHHSNYVVWFEAGRVAWMSAVAMPYTEVAAGGHHFAVTGIDVQYRTPAYFGDTVRLSTRLVELRSRQVAFEYELRRVADGDLLATGHSQHICIDLDGKMARIPRTVVERMVSGMAALAQTEEAPFNA